MEELLELRELLQRGNISSALLMIDEMEEMSKKDILNKIRSYGIILLLHLIKQEIEKRTTRSWDVSIRNAILEIQNLNARPKSKGTYLDDCELRESLESAYRQAINQASLEINEGQYDSSELQQMVNKQDICNRVMDALSVFPDDV
jgi:vacuolar-type H+-ATPase subunit F/Vma7